MLSNVSKAQFGLGLFIVAVAATLLLLGVIESGLAIATGLIGINLLATSGSRLR